MVADTNKKWQPIRTFKVKKNPYRVILKHIIILGIFSFFTILNIISLALRPANYNNDLNAQLLFVVSWTLCYTFLLYIIFTQRFEFQIAEQGIIIEGEMTRWEDVRDIETRGKYVLFLIRRQDKQIMLEDTYDFAENKQEAYDLLTRYRQIQKKVS